MGATLWWKGSVDGGTQTLTTETSCPYVELPDKPVLCATHSTASLQPWTSLFVPCQCEQTSSLLSACLPNLTKNDLLTHTDVQAFISSCMRVLSVNKVLPVAINPLFVTVQGLAWHSTLPYLVSPKKPDTDISPNWAWTPYACKPATHTGSFYKYLESYLQ